MKFLKSGDFILNIGCTGLVLILFINLLLMLNCNFSLVDAEVQTKLEKLKFISPADCSVCHNQKRILPVDHIETLGMTYKECEKCHKHGSSSLRGKMTLDHMHRLSGIKCDGCHEKSNYTEAVSTEKCLSCHGSYQEVADRSAHLDPNPHKSLHYGIEVECDLCHHQHCDSENFCSQCHEWPNVVP